MTNLHKKLDELLNARCVLHDARRVVDVTAFNLAFDTYYDKLLEFRKMLEKTGVAKLTVTDKAIERFRKIAHRLPTDEHEVISDRTFLLNVAAQLEQYARQDEE